MMAEMTSLCHAATPMVGQILVAGGNSGDTITNTAEVFNPLTSAWTPTGSMNDARIEFQMVLLTNDVVLASGGSTPRGAPNAPQGGPTSNSEVWDPSTGIWTLTGNMVQGRSDFRIVLLQNGNALAAGGVPGSAPLSQTAEIFNPSTLTWTATGSMNVGRLYFQMVTLPNGMVLAAGGITDGTPHFCQLLQSSMTQRQAAGP